MRPNEPRAAGYQVALSDRGTGEASLAARLGRETSCIFSASSRRVLLAVKRNGPLDPFLQRDQRLVAKVSTRGTYVSHGMAHVTSPLRPMVNLEPRAEGCLQAVGDLVERRALPAGDVEHAPAHTRSPQCRDVCTNHVLDVGEVA